MTQPNFRDVELLSAYLDGQLPQAESARLEMRLKADPQLRTVFADLSQSRALLRKLPARRAPRNFTLTPKMAGVKPPVPCAFPLFRFASALAAILFFFGLTANLALPALSNTFAAAPVPAYGIGGGNAEPAQEAAPAAPAAAAPAPTEAPAATAAPAATEAPSMLVPAAPTMSAQDNSVLTPTAEAPRTMASLATETSAPTETEPAPPAQSKISPTEPSALVVSTPIPREVQPPVPLTVEIGLLVLAVLAGAAALFVRWQADRKFSQIIKRK